jgi:SAM-dependent methyltransferase
MAETKAERVDLLDDTPSRNYAAKLRRFNEFARPEICAAIASLGLRQGMHVLDVGCGTGEGLRWLHESINGIGVVAGLDLSRAHVAAARALAPPDVPVVQADLLWPPFPKGFFDVLWCVNTIAHLRHPIDGLTALRSLLRDGGRIALGQSGFMAEMFFAWDSRLERVACDAVRKYYQERYGLDERMLTSFRGLVGLLQQAGLRDVTARTYIIERVFPLSPADEAYLYEAIFRDTWGARLEPYMSAEDFDSLSRLCDPDSPEFALRRRDFHFLQTFSLVVGHS